MFINFMLIGNYFKKLSPDCKNFIITGLSFNSEKCKKGNIFFAIKGSKFDGNNYINSAIKRGAKVIISEKKIFKIFKILSL